MAAREPPGIKVPAAGQKNTSIPTFHLAVSRNRSIVRPSEAGTCNVYITTQGTALTRGKCLK